jgi:nitrate/nitrite transporter NarK
VITYVGAWLSDRWGRRPFAIMFAALTLVAVWSITLVPSGAPLYLAGALLFGFNGATWTISFVHSTELYPNQIRGSGIGTTMACGRVASILAPLFFGIVGGPLGHRRRLSPGRPCLDPHDHPLSAVARDQRDRAGADRRTGHLDGGAAGRDTAAAAVEVKPAASYPVRFWRIGSQRSSRRGRVIGWVD